MKAMMKKTALLLLLSAMSLQGVSLTQPVLAAEEASGESFEEFTSEETSEKASQAFEEAEARSRWAALQKAVEETQSETAASAITEDENDMGEVWSLHGYSWEGNRLSLDFGYAAKHPVFAAILPLSGEAAVTGECDVDLDGFLAGTLVSEAGQAGLLLSEYGLQALENGQTIDVHLELEFEGDGPYALHMGAQKIVSETLPDETQCEVSDENDDWPIETFTDVSEDPDSSDFADSAFEESELSADAQNAWLDQEFSAVADEFEKAGANGARILYGSMDSKITTLKSKFGNHRFWNHPASDTSGNPESITDHVTDDKAYIGNEFDGMALCNGFSYLCYFKTHGVRVNSTGTRHVSGNEGVRIGDVIHTRHAYDHPVLGHYSYVWKIVGDTYYKLEGTYKQTDMIWQTNTVRKSDIVDYFTLADSGTYALYAFTGPDNSATHSLQQHGSTLTMPQPTGQSKYARFNGYTICNYDNGAFLYDNGQGNYRWFNTQSEASAAGYKNRTIKKAGETLPGLFSAGMTIALLSDWVKLPYTLTIDPNGGKVASASLKAYVNDTVSVPANSQPTRAGYRLAGFIPYNTKGLRLYKGSNGLYKAFADDAAARKNGYSPVTLGTQFKELLTEKENDRIILKAQWSQLHYSLNFSNLFESKISTGQTWTYGQKVTIPKGPLKRSGYTFNGWSVRYNGQILCEKIDGKNKTYRLYTSLDDAANAGYTMTRLPAAGSFTISWSNPNVTKIDLAATWKQNNPDAVSMNRLYNPNSGEHFYTANTAERDRLVKLGWKNEGIGWYAPRQSKTPVYRLYNPNAGDHHYTISAGERDSLVKVGWKDEGIGWYSDDEKTNPVFRQYNPNARAGAHNYTTNMAEHLNLMRLTWRGEGIGWYGMSISINGENAMMDNAHKIYSFFKMRGNSDAQIAGILANWQTESGIDSTKLESYYQDDYQWTSQKDSMIRDLSAYTTDYVFPLYDKSGISISREAYKGYDGKYYCGIGMFGCTGPAAQRMLEKAEQMNTGWWDFDWQLAYAAVGYRPGAFDRADFLAISSPEEAAIWVLGNYEGCPGHSSGSLRSQRAAAWMDLMKDWAVDEDYANSVMNIASALGLQKSSAPMQTPISTPAASSAEESAFENESSTSVQSPAEPVATPSDNAFSESSMEDFSDTSDTSSMEEMPME